MFTKVFIGTRVTSEMSDTLPALKREQLVEATYEGKGYVGKYLEEATPTLEQVTQTFDALDQLFNIHAPHITPHWICFPQRFFG